MNNDIYRFQFDQNCAARDVLDTLQLAILATECLHGESQVQLDAAYCTDSAANTYVIDARTSVGRDLVLLFIGFALREYGEKAVSVTRTRTFPRPEPKCA